MVRRLNDCPDLRIFSGSVIRFDFGAGLSIIPGAGAHETADDGAVPGDFQTPFKSEAHPASVKTAESNTLATKLGLYFVRFFSRYSMATLTLIDRIQIPFNYGLAMGQEPERYPEKALGSEAGHLHPKGRGLPPIDDGRS